MQANPAYEIVTICDRHGPSRELAAKTVPGAVVVEDPEDVFADETLDAVGLFTLADVRPALIRRALACKLHIIAEKPIAADTDTEWELVKEIEASDRIVAVNLFNRNAWYHKEIQAFIREGEIGDLAIIRVCHMTPGHMPGEGHDPEGPPFHDCGMHYVDVARWYAQSEYATWHAQGIRMWNHTEPWWVQAHGAFTNGVVFDITQGFVYGHLAKDKTHNCYVDLIGTKGICRMTHDFKTATIDCRGINTTTQKTAAFNDKKLDVLCANFAKSLAAGKNLGLPTPRDSAVASQVAWAMLRDAVAHQPPTVGTKADLQEILKHRRSLRDGFGLPVHAQEPPMECAEPGKPPVACGEDLCSFAENPASAPSSPAMQG